MATGEQITEEASAFRAARAAGVDVNGGLSLSAINKRRTQLWTTSIFVIVAVTVAFAVLPIAQDALPASLRFRELSSWIVVALVGGLAVAFLIYVIEKELRLRRLTAMLLDERVLSSALSNRLSEISALSEVGKAMNTTLGLQDVLQLILASALELLDGTEGSIMLLEDDGEYLRVVSYQGGNAANVMKARTKLGEGIAGGVAKSLKPALVQGIDRLQGHPERGIHSAMCVPLRRDDEVLGVLNVNETQGQRRYNEQDMDSLGLFAEHAAIAIGNARLYEQQRETVSRLEELDRLKSDFVATVSHELKTPLTAIIGAAKTVSKKGPSMDPEAQGSFMQMIERQGNRLLRLVEDVLSASRIESGLHKTKRELIDLRELAGEVIEDVRHTQQGRGREVTLETDPERPQVWGDTTFINQILFNLVENALKYSDGAVEVTAQEDAAAATLTVRDHGSGIPPEQLKTIFDRFRQVDSSSTRKVGGFGLGLFIVKNLVDSHQGTIDVESGAGKGTTFRVRFPKRSSDRS